MTIDSTSADSTWTDESNPEPEPIGLSEPAGGVPPVIDDEPGLSAAVAALSAGTGPIAIDAERASGYRYGHRAFLIQIRRAKSGTHLIDPTGVRDFGALSDAMRLDEWVLHSADQDLPCLADLGLAPRTLFDTELAAKLLGKPRFGLGNLIEDELGFSLAKEHSAADWSRRPLPEPWLRYAALDVELLIELRDVLDQQLSAKGRRDWAVAEFEYVANRPTVRRIDPWRRTSGINVARTPRQLALVREMWTTRDEFARHLDRAPHRVLPDAAIASVAEAQPKNRHELSELAEFRGRGTRRHIDRWWSAVARAQALPERELPPRSPASAGPPPPRSWRNRHPAAATRLAAAREALQSISEELNIPVATLLEPSAVRAVCWEPPLDLTVEAVSDALASAGARSWQISICAEAIACALRESTKAV